MNQRTAKLLRKWAVHSRNWIIDQGGHPRDGYTSRGFKKKWNRIPRPLRFGTRIAMHEVLSKSGISA